MSASYTAVGWNRNKLIYDGVLVLLVVGYISIFRILGPELNAASLRVDAPTLDMQAFGSCAFLMLSVILCIGPLARLDARFLPLLYNRRHFGVMTCIVAMIHALSVLDWYFNLSPKNPYIALLSSNTSFGQFAGFPFEVFGILALLILMVLAATSHDFWLNFLTPPVWKAIHMGLYPAYVLIVLHISLGAILAGSNFALPVIVGFCGALVGGLHLAAAIREKGVDQAFGHSQGEWVFACDLGDISEKCAKVVALSDQEKVAIFRYDGKLSAITNICAHQNGPLGEGRIIGGCVTCPWHGFQYRPEDGRAPAPYTEKLATYQLKLEGGKVWLDPRANAPGTYVEPVRIDAPTGEA